MDDVLAVLLFGAWRAGLDAAVIARAIRLLPAVQGGEKSELARWLRDLAKWVEVE